MKIFRKHCGMSFRMQRAKNKASAKRVRVKSPKKGFKTERALVSHFVAAAKTYPPSESRLICTEFDATNGIADIVQVRLRKNWKDNISLGKIYPRWAFALHQLPYRRVFSTQYFQEMCGTSRSTTLAILRHFTRLSYCVRRRKGWLKQRQLKPLATEIVSIEAKLSDWRRALNQAYRHLDYAHRSWVLLDATRSSAALKNLSRFKRLNLGLIILAPGRRPRVLFSPKKCLPKSGLRFWFANAELGRRLRFQVVRVVTIDGI